MNTKDEALNKTDNDISQTIGKAHVDIFQTIDTKVGNALKGKLLEISVEGSTMASIKLIFFGWR